MHTITNEVRWPFKRIQTPLINLTITLFDIGELLPIMATEPLAQTLQQLRITISDLNDSSDKKLNDLSPTPRMNALNSRNHMLVDSSLRTILARIIPCTVIILLKFMKSIEYRTIWRCLIPPCSQQTGINVFVC